MIKLHYFVLCPFARKIKITLAEKALNYELIRENIVHEQDNRKTVRSFEEMLVLRDGNQKYTNHIAIDEYLEERYPRHSLLADSLQVRANIRMISNLFDNQFYHQVVKKILYERLYKSVTNRRAPDSNLIRKVRQDIALYLDYIEKLLSASAKWLAGEQLSRADIVVASHISVLDYFGDIPWSHNQEVREWYAVFKSRPSMKTILEDRIAGFDPAPDYCDP